MWKIVWKCAVLIVIIISTSLVFLRKWLRFLEFSTKTRNKENYWRPQIVGNEGPKNVRNIVKFEKISRTDVLCTKMWKNGYREFRYNGTLSSQSKSEKSYWQFSRHFKGTERRGFCCVRSILTVNWQKCFCKATTKISNESYHLVPAFGHFGIVSL